MGGPGAPDLTKVGAAAEHTKEWLTEKIRDPRKVKPDGKMPPFPADKISDADLKNLVDYLVSLKDDPKGGKPGGKPDGKPDGKGGKQDNPDGKGGKQDNKGGKAGNP
jgi:mono/diheme cytochrome c family protein